MGRGDECGGFREAGCLTGKRSGLCVQGLGCRLVGVGFGVQGRGCRLEGVGSGVWGLR